MRTKLIITSMLFPVWYASAGSVLDAYIKEAFANNEPLQQRHFQLDKSLYALKEANGLFLPTVSVQGNYYLAKGGRTIAFPLGNLFNPVYGTLNQLTSSSSFPTLQNQNIQFNPNNFLDAKLHTTMPIINAEIYFNKRIKQKQIGVQQAEINVYKRELVKDIKQAYLQYQQSVEVQQIYRAALERAREGERISRSLIKNGSGTQADVLGTRSEIANLETELIKAENNSKNASAYFNFLLNRSFESPIETDPAFLVQSALPVENDTSFSTREERKKLDATLEATGESNRLNKAFVIPKLNAFMDLGYQGFLGQEDYRPQYYFFGLTLDWPIFSGFRNHYKTKQSELEVANLRSQYNDLDNRLRLQVQTTYNNYRSSLESFRSAKLRETSDERYLADLNKRYREGQALYVELLGARSQFVQSQVQSTVAQYQVWISATELERVCATYPL